MNEFVAKDWIFQSDSEISTIFLSFTNHNLICLHLIKVAVLWFEKTLSTDLKISNLLKFQLKLKSSEIIE